MQPDGSSAILAVSHTALFPMIEVLLGGSGTPGANINRQITDIEKSILEPVIRILLQELQTAWRPIIRLDFIAEQPEIAQRVLASIAANEGFVAARLELRLGEATGTLHLGLPLRAIRSLLPNCQATKPAFSAEERSHLLRLIGRAELDVSVSLNGPRMLFRDLLSIEAGDVIAFDYPLNQELDLELNGIPKFKGHVVARGTKRGFQIKRDCPRVVSALNPPQPVK
jgi:flagellar motor switch protein FliM